LELSEVSRVYAEVESEIARVFVGQDEVLSAVLVGMLARGHVLLEGVPGVGKTLLVRALGRVLGCHFRRVQFTPDLMPSDVTGSTLYNPQKGAFEFKHGPVFTHLLLADEVNRAPAKTQSAMLEAMAERSVTVDGITHPLPSPHFVLATQNPLESAGTYALPEAQLDRFLFKVLIAHPTREAEELLLRNVRDGFDASDLDAVGLRQLTDAATLARMQRAVQSVTVDDAIIGYIVSIVHNTRRHRAVQIGASPRAAVALLATARVEAAIRGRDFAVPDDVKRHGPAVLRHRLLLQPDAELEGVTADEVVAAVLRETRVPGMGEAQGPRAGRASQHDTLPPRAAAALPPSPPPSSGAFARAPNFASSRPAGAPASGPARPAGVDPDTLPPPRSDPFGDRGGSSG
jgi:MoxR-like ATPase